ncbi:uncharacterized protein LOC129919731 [Episyrphus balteatus]|uniref:uncharacterized protein LOC129919731 n=1 Tax=Episyrphus balteatus TaxID=286459 RepID=UPI0024866537|nr:uncharacterized protein LOC129919731 [Episyrphus balteatus]XP_055856689.1 uncharacterized protein LOC129919731 [Episyrphus balteatus]XP_055856690.1 uncharacterized protein LOC129919731 [Episyrphus balteatus]XP_055856691.1 uncharacterized protein LOC129919731 [Episyrphus balteatus]
MGDIDYDSKFNEMQKYIPFLDRVIEKLKNNDQDKPRKAQLDKMQTLHGLLNNKEKKLKMETLLKCESVLKKLYAKIEKSDDVAPSNPSSISTTTTTTRLSSDAASVTAKNVHNSTPASQIAAPHITPASQATSARAATASARNKFVPNRNLIEIYTCPASPPHLGEEDFRPPVEIPTERRSSPVKFLSSPRWDQKSSKETIEKQIPTHPSSTASRFQNRSTDFFHSTHHKPTEKPQKTSRWSDSRDHTRDISPASSSAHHRSWSATSTSYSSSNKNRSSHGQKSSIFSSEEENWDEPEEDTLPKSKPDPKTTNTSTSSKSSHHHRQHDKSYRSQAEHSSSPQPPPSAYHHVLPESSMDNDAFQNRLYHETIYNYKKPDAFSSFMNPPPPEARTPPKPQPVGNVFNRLGDKVDPYENFSIRVKNDKIKSSKAPHRPIQSPPPPPPPLLVQTRPIGEVLKSPPLSADDIDDLLNESLEAAIGKQKKSLSSSENSKDPKKPTSLDAVRKKLAMISKPASPSPELGSPPRVENKSEEEPFYRRGHTPTKKPIDIVENEKVTETGPKEATTTTPTTVQPSSSTCPLPSPKSPPNPMDRVVERLALKYKPHKRRESVCVDRSQFQQTEKTSTPPSHTMDPKINSVGHRGHVTDPRVAKNMAHIPPLMATPVPNVLPTINHFDPRLRNTHPLNKDHIPFSVPKPYSPIPSLLDIHIPLIPPLAAYNAPVNSGVQPPLPSYNIPNIQKPPLPNYIPPNSNRIDPRTHKPPAKIYADKFNAERNDKTERMKYLESKRNKPPEPKTYGEYRKRQQMEEEESSKTATTTDPTIPVAPTIQSMVPSTLDKMYRNADYGKEMTGSIQGFKIPKKPKPVEEPKVVDTKKDDSELKPPEESTKTVESSGKVGETLKKPEEEPTKKSEKDQSEANELPKQKEKLPKQNDKNVHKETKKSTIPETKKSTTKSQVIEDDIETDFVKIENDLKTSKKSNKKPKEIIYIIDSDNEGNDSDGELLKSSSQTSEILDSSINESRLVIDESETTTNSLENNAELETPTKTTMVEEKDESENDSPQPRLIRSRRLRNKNNVSIIENTPSPEKIETKILPPPPPPPAAAAKPKLNEEEKKEEVKPEPRRITTRRSTIIVREPPEPQVERRKSESPCSRRTASDIFSPTTDNSVVSTQNIITGKRRTRASINFNEKNTKKPATPKTTATPPVTAPSASTPPSTTPTQTRKTRAKSIDCRSGGKKAQQKKDIVEKKNLEDGQICAVSSTTEGPHNEPPVVSEISASPEEPSSSNAVDPQTAVVDADNKKKQEFLEGFLMSIVDPTTNKDRILDMLKSVLDEKKLQQVKEILYSPAKDDSKNESAKEKELQEHEPESNKPRVTKHKKNELDRLNEDIRDMFICQGVVTATGRRMCTLAKETETPRETRQKKPVPVKNPVKKKNIPLKSAKGPTQPASLLNKRPMRKAKVLISPLNIRALRSRNPKANTSPKMPTLAPNTPIKLPNETHPKVKNRKISEGDVVETKKTSKNSKLEEDDDEEMFIPIKKKPGPKSKRQASDVSSETDSSDDDIELAYLKNKIKKLDESKSEKENNKKLKVVKKTEKEQEETEKVVSPKEEEAKPKTKVVLPKEETKPKAKVEVPKEETKTKNDEKEKVIETNESEKTVEEKEDKPEQKSEVFVKNTNPEYHTKSDYSNCCVICKEKARFIAPHYLLAHNDSEVYTSRLPQAVLEDIKLNIGNRAFYSIPKKPQIAYQYNCPFCDFKSAQTLRGWMEHFTIHTGEYGQKCSKCFKAMNSASYLSDHLKKSCPGAKKINRDPINLRGLGINGYVCQLCNFTQMLQGNVVRHLKIHHSLEDPAAAKSNIFEIRLIDVAGVPKRDDIKVDESVTDTSLNDSSAVLKSVPDVVPSTPKESSMVIEEDPLKLTQEDNLVELDSNATNTILSVDDKVEAENKAETGNKTEAGNKSEAENKAESENKSKAEAEKKITDEDEESINELSIIPNMEAFLPRTLISPTSGILKELSPAELDEIIDLDDDSIFPDEPTAPSISQTPVEKPSSIAIKPANMEVFLPRDIASPTSLVLTESLKSIEKDNDSSLSKTKPTEKRMTIAEKLSQRFKNIEKQNIADDAASTGKTIPEKDISHEVSVSSVPEVDQIEERPATSEKACQLPTVVNSPASNRSINESGGNLVIDEQNDSQTRDDDAASDSDDAGYEDEEDDNDNWEDIEITETKGGTQKDKNNKNKSIYKTLSRLYASIAPKKTSKKTTKEKEKKKAETSQKSLSETVTSASKSNDKQSTSEENSDPAPKPTEKPQQQHRLPNLSEFILDSQTDSLDILLNSNFNCLEGDGSSFPHLDLNDLDSSIFPLPEEQENIQDAIAMATDLDSNKYDILGNPVSISPNSAPPKQQPLSTIIQKIGCFGFSLCGNSLKYYCMVKSCAFLFSDHPDGLQNHFLLDHPNLKWDGYCHTCKMQVDYGDCREMKHLLDVHSKVRTDDPGSGGGGSDKPRIKFRRLTGDILSTDKPKIDTASNEVVFESFSPAPSRSATPQSALPFTITSSYNSPSYNSPSPSPKPVNVSSSKTPTYTLPSTNPSLDISLSEMLQSEPKAMLPSKSRPKHRELSLSSMLQSEPKAMIPPKAPPTSKNIDIPLFKNVSKEFAITNVAEGVSDNDLLNMVFKQVDSSPGGIQISQVVSLNAGGKSVSHMPMKPVSNSVTVTPVPIKPIPGRITLSGRRSSVCVSSAFRDQQSRASPKPNQMTSLLTQRNTSSPKPNQMTSLLTQRNTSSPMPKNQHMAFVCGVMQCSFSTNMRSTMNEHISSHIRRDNNRDALKCHICPFVGQEIASYFSHMTLNHSRPDGVVTSSPLSSTTFDLTQKIQDILRNTGKPKPNQSSEQEPQQISQPTSQEISTPPAAPPAATKVAKPTDTSFASKVRKAAEEVVAETGLPEEEIWRCIFFPECDCTVSEKDFQTHLGTHTNIVPTSFPSIPPGSSLHCPHCTVNYYRAAVLKAHMKTHARHQYFCFICSLTTFANYHQVQKHFSDIHARSGNLRPQNMIPDDESDKPAFFVTNDVELSPMELVQFGEKLIVDWERKKALNKTHFQPSEQNLLPLQPIFNNQVYCSVCNYKTKVRTNMFRHLQLHNQDVDVGSVDPVNPVPCLEKNEKHFDKMTNLACSSNTGGPMKPKESVKIPVFVPDLRRYVCGHPGCKYLTLTDQMLRSHLNALHGSEKGYMCPHCQEEICKKNMCAERIVQHLKFHGNKIYQCSECEYFHYTKHVVERHVNEKHTTVPFVNLLTYDRSENETKKTSQVFPGRNVTTPSQSEYDSPAEPPTTSSTPPNTRMKWECAICKHQTVTWNQMISHANSLHNAKHQYHCVHCSFGSAHLAHIMDHIDSKHPTKIREAKYVFYKINETQQDKAADTRPLWSRNDPKRVRSIRGILMENEEDAERTKKNLSRAGVDSDEDLDDGEYDDVIPVSDSESSTIPGGLSCFHCNYTSVEMSSLAQHWKTKHWHEKNNEMVPRLPFFFRVHTILKCPLCTHVGDHINLKIHLINVHGQKNFCAADPNLSNTCGHCPFVYPPKRLEVLTNHYLREHKPTDVKNLSSGLLKNLLALGECQVYMQCYFCAEICADKTSIIEHERERHKNSNFRYKQIKDDVIYRCGLCQYSSTNELATLRHMIDHFSGFSFCHFCKSAQSNFNSYMQHCYSSHVKALASFKEIYKFDTVAAFLGQMLLIFPNGLIINKKNLQHTQYGNTERIQAMYDEICKKALEPPIPPLCMGRLLAAKKSSLEAQTLLPPPPQAVTAKRIAKRRSTVAMGGCERGLTNFLVPPEPQKIKKRKSSICGDFVQPTAPLFSTITKSNNVVERSIQRQPAEIKEPQGFSFYGKKPDPIDLSKIYTHIAIGDKYAPVSVKKFSLLFKINTKVMVEPMDHRRYHHNQQAKKRNANFNRPCPASKKKRLA